MTARETMTAPLFTIKIHDMNIPYGLMLTRFLLAPTIVYLALRVPNAGNWITLLMALGLLTDILDGIVARQMQVATETMRRLDSQADLLFWLAVGYASWQLHADILRPYWVSIVAIFTMEAACYVISLLRFRRETCTHAYLSKLFGLSMFFAFFYLFTFAKGGMPLWTAIVVGLVSHVDRILITLILPRWTFDVPSFYHAYQIRQGKTIKKYSLFN